ncbi:MAG TPA: hypothetical protein EYM58_09975 [Rhodospirillales bacterium]|nr:hypothetical protein [Rhodospirillales bacterium]
MTAVELEELKKCEESLFLFYELAKEAREAGYDDDETTQVAIHSNYGNMEFLESEGGTAPYSDEQVLEDMDFNVTDGIEPDGKG